MSAIRFVLLGFFVVWGLLVNVLNIAKFKITNSEGNDDPVDTGLDLIAMPVNGMAVVALIFLNRGHSSRPETNVAHIWRKFDTEDLSGLHVLHRRRKELAAVPFTSIVVLGVLAVLLYFLKFFHCDIWIPPLGSSGMPEGFRHQWWSPDIPAWFLAWMRPSEYACCCVTNEQHPTCPDPSPAISHPPGTVFNPAIETAPTETVLGALSHISGMLCLNS
jgi:hypothetical protein